MKRHSMISYSPYLHDVNDYEACIEDIYKTGFLSNCGKFYHMFKDDIIDRIGNENVVLSSSADIALFATALEMISRHGVRVGMNGFTFNSTINTFKLAGAEIQFIDADLDTCNVSFDDLQAVVANGIDVLVLTHVYGNVIDIDKVRTIWSGPIVWDAAQAYGANYKGKPIGSFGDVEIFSFSPTKVLTSGEGGAVCTTDNDLLKDINLRLRYGFDVNYVSKFPGVNGKLSEPNAALGHVNHPYLDSNLMQRNRQYELYRSGISSNGIRWPFIEFDSTHKDISILMDNKTMAIQMLAADEIPFKEYFIPPSRYGYLNIPTLKNIERIHMSVINLPLGPKVTDGDIELVCDVINASKP